MNTPKQTVEAKVWPPFSDENAKKAVSHLRSTLAPSPNEAPKCYCKCHDVPRNWKLTCSCNCQPPPPDKEWEKPWTHLNKIDLTKDWYIAFTHTFNFIGNCKCGEAHLYDIEGNPETINHLYQYVKALILSKDQEADRRVEEVIGEIEDLNNSWDGDFFSMETDDWIKLKKKLSSK